MRLGASAGRWWRCSRKSARFGHGSCVTVHSFEDDAMDEHEWEEGSGETGVAKGVLLFFSSLFFGLGVAARRVIIISIIFFVVDLCSDDVRVGSG